MNKLDLYKTFARVTELASFTQASESLGLPKSTVSEHVRLLEELLGARLLQRTTRKVQATQDGLVLYERCKDMLDQVDELESLFRQDQSVLRGRLRIDLPTVTAREYVLPHLAEFSDLHPYIELELSATDRRVDLVREGFDCVLRVGELPDATLVARPLGALRQANYASPAYLERYGTPRTLADLANHRLVHYVSNFGSRSAGFEYQQDGKRHGLPMAGTVTVNNTDCYNAACLAGFGIIQAPVAGKRESLARGELVEVLPEWVAAPMSVTLLYAHRRNLPQRVKVFMDWLAVTLQPQLNA
ncbi:DNA-binding transcriptional LysR family regulator [Pseudomonas sp. TE3786]